MRNRVAPPSAGSRVQPSSRTAPPSLCRSEARRPALLRSRLPGPRSHGRGPRVLQLAPSAAVATGAGGDLTIPASFSAYVALKSLQVFAGYEHPPGFIIGSAPVGLRIRGQKIENPEMHFSRDQLIGSAFIAFGITLFVCFFYVAIVSKLLPPYENRFLAAIQNDWYYCLLVPLTLPVIIVAVYLHWLSMKMFKHA